MVLPIPWYFWRIVNFTPYQSFIIQMSNRLVKPWYGYGTKRFLEYYGFDREEKYYGYVS